MWNAGALELFYACLRLFVDSKTEPMHAIQLGTEPKHAIQHTYPSQMKRMLCD